MNINRWKREHQANLILSLFPVLFFGMFAVTEIILWVVNS